jgi:hypothetical protein
MHVNFIQIPKSLFDLAEGDRFKVLRDQVDVPVLEVNRGRLDYVPRSPDVKPQIVLQDDAV